MTLPSARAVKVADVVPAPRPSDRPKQVIELAPRKVPASLVARLLFGSPLGVFGWIFAAFGMLFVLLFVPRALPDFTSYDGTAFGEVEHVEKTNMSENDDHIWRVAYTFEDNAGRVHHGESYTTDDVTPHTERLVEYTRANPNVSRLKGMSRRPFGVLALMVLLFPIVGLALAGRVFVRGIRAARLLRRGIETTGKVIDVESTRLKVQRERIMRATVEFAVGDRAERTTFDVGESGAPARDEIRRLIYDPAAPSRASTLDDLPGKPRITTEGKLAWSSGSAALVLIAPIVAVIEIALLPFVL
jgi:hypothetical protein